MSGYEFEGKNCFVYTDERYGEIRTVIDSDGERRFVGIDIAECMGFEAPTKAVKRSNIPGKMVKVPWVSGNRKGETNARCFNKREAERFIKNGLMPPKGFKDWFDMVVAAEEEPVEKPAPIQKRESDIPKKPVTAGNVNIAGVFDRLDEIVLEIMMLKKELSASLDKSM